VLGIGSSDGRALARAPDSRSKKAVLYAAKQRAVILLQNAGCRGLQEFAFCFLLVTTASPLCAFTFFGDTQALAGGIRTTKYGM
jgi:hypothetical protein